MIDAALMAESRQLLNEARMIAEAPAAQTSVIGHSHPGGAVPRGGHWTEQGNFVTGQSTLQAFAQRIGFAVATGSDHDVRKANEWARKQLDLLKRGVPGRREETIAERQVRIEREYPGVSAPVVARKERMSASLVRSDREARGLDAATGEKLPARLRKFAER